MPNNLFYRFQDLAIDQFHEIRTKAGGLIILLPQKLPGLSKEEQEVHTLH